LVVPNFHALEPPMNAPTQDEERLARLRDPVVVAAIGGVAALLLFTVVFAALPARRVDLLFEAAKAAVAVLPLAFFGVIVADLVRRRDAKRDQDDHAREAQRDLDRNRDEYRRQFLNNVVVSYNRVKGVRRSLRAAGFGLAVSGKLSADQLGRIDSEMASLNEAQLDLERMKREVEGRSDVLTRAPLIFRALETLEIYANGPIKDWESGRSKLRQGVDVNVLKQWRAFQLFIASAHEGGDFGIAAEQMREVEKAIWPDLLRLE
jgi:hypothetical protein